jgi:hypothetical protein
MPEINETYLKGLILRLKRLEYEITELRKRILELERELGRRKEEELVNPIA